MPLSLSGSLEKALEDFRRARRQGELGEIVAWLQGRPTDLLAYEDVRRSLKLQGQFARGLQDIPLDAIVGSVERYHDFTRSFLPKNPSAAYRWARVQMAAGELAGLPPIEVYQIGQAYFVLDGNHRVSVARRHGVPTISAYVYEVPTLVPLSPDDSPDDLIVKAEYADFLTTTGLARLRPGASLLVSVPGQYRVLLEQIALHHDQLRRRTDSEVSYQAAVGSWYDEVYLPVVEIIRRHDLLSDFPGRTETDLYVWIVDHHAALEGSLGWRVRPAAAAEDFARQRSATPRRVAERVGTMLRSTMVPPVLDSGPAPGFWRREQRIAHQAEHLVGDILVPIDGSDIGWQALDQTLMIARREAAIVHGLHVERPQSRENRAAIEALRDEWQRRCAAAGIQNDLAFDRGGVADSIVARARWADLIVIGLAHPPGSAPLARLGSGFSDIIHRSPRTILAVPQTCQFQRMLLAYDGSPKAEEALFAATYIALRWKAELVVVTAVDGQQTTPATLARPREYLTQHEVSATYIARPGPAAQAIVAAADEYGSDLIIVGGYGFNRLYKAMFGSTVDHILRASPRPTLICR